MLKSNVFSFLKTDQTASQPSDRSSSQQPSTLLAMSPPNTQKSVSCVIPCLNERANLQKLIPLLAECLSSLVSCWEIIVVDDGSQDGTEHCIADLLLQTPQIKYIQLSRNFGKEAAMTAGLMESTGDAVVLIDADLQHPPELISQMFERWQNGVEMVFAVRADRSDEHYAKRCATKLFYMFFHTLMRSPYLYRNSSDFRLMDRKIVQAILDLPERTRFMKGMYAWVGFHTESIAYVPHTRLHGETHYNFRRLLSLALNGILSFSQFPVKILFSLGVFLLLICAVLGLYLLVYRWRFPDIDLQWSWLMNMMLLLEGINMVALSIVALVISKIFDEVRSRPLFIIRKKIQSLPKVD